MYTCLQDTRKRLRIIFVEVLIMPANLHEVAARAGVSLATASRALNGKSGVSQETRDRVLAIAQELQYSASMAARDLATARTETLSYVVHQRDGPLDVDTS